jgi:hypothetical protein
MKKIYLLLFVLVVLTSCASNNVRFKTPEGNEYVEYNDYVQDRVNTMKSPIVLIAVKHSESWGYSIVIKDSSGVIETIGNASIFANAIGQSRKVGDTIK